MAFKLTSTIQPFPSDISFLEADAAYWVAKAARIEAERRWEPKEEGRLDTVGVKATTHSKENERQLVALTITEAAHKAELDLRIEATEAAGRVLGIDALCKMHKLGAVERTTLLLCVYAALDEGLETALCRAAPPAYGARISPEVIWSLTELDFAQRATEGRRPFSPSAPLLLNNLVTLTLGRTATPADLRSGSLAITQAAFDHVLGVANIDAKSVN